MSPNLIADIVNFEFGCSKDPSSLPRIFMYPKMVNQKQSSHGDLEPLQADMSSEGRRGAETLSRGQRGVVGRIGVELEHVPNRGQGAAGG